MTADADPSVHRHALRRQLEQARLGTGASHARLAAALGWTLPDLLLVAAVADGFDDGRLAVLMDHLGVTAPGPVQAPPESPFDQAVRVLVGYEAEADRVSSFEPFVIPGLLQTRAYAQAVLRFYAPPPKVEALVDARMARQEQFAREDGPAIAFLIDESALHRGEGATGEDAAIRRDQLAHLRAMAAHPRVRIRILPYAAGVHEGVKGPFVILESGSPLLYLEDAKGDVISADPARIEEHRDRFERLAAQSSDLV